MLLAKARLISYSQATPTPTPTHDTINASAQDLVAYCARVSNPANQNDDGIQQSNTSGSGI